MTEQRKKEIIERLMTIYNNFEPDEKIWQMEPDMWWLMSTYNNTYGNPELIGGKWVRENIPELADLP